MPAVATALGKGKCKMLKHGGGGEGCCSVFGVHSRQLWEAAWQRACCLHAMMPAVCCCCCLLPCLFSLSLTVCCCLSVPESPNQWSMSVFSKNPSVKIQIERVVEKKKEKEGVYTWDGRKAAC